jgi:SAM-dependent methyltransferase
MTRKIMVTRPHYTKPTEPAPHMTVVRQIVACRLCRSGNLWPFFTLGPQPLANDLLRPEHWDQPEFRAPLSVLRCEECQHVQLTHTVPPTQLFGTYRFQSGSAEGWHDHCTGLAETLTKRRGAGFLVDIGSNDGTLLGKFKKLGWKVLGVDPARNLARRVPIKTEVCFWTQLTAQSIRAEHGRADVLVAQNVLGHVDDPVDFLQGIAAMLKPAGEAIIEVPDLYCLLAQGEFDTIYHEHLSYWSVMALAKAAALAGLAIFQIQHLRMHGGSFRAHLKHINCRSLTVRSNVGVRIVKDFRQLANQALFEGFQGLVERKLAQIQELLATAETPLWGYAASAKATVLLNALHERGSPLPEWIIDDTPGKHGCLIPGVRIPVAKPEAMGDCRTLMLLAWNWAEGLMLRAKNRGFQGRYLIPMPEPRIDNG